MNSTSRLAPLLALLLLTAGTRQAPGDAASGSPAQTLVSHRKPTVAVDVSVAHEARAAINRALDWLATRQKPDGSWSDTNFPALTALPLWAFAWSEHPGRAEAIRRAVPFILSCVQPDGGIYRIVPGKGGGLSNYNTAICMVALHAVNDPALTPVIQRARAFVSASQYLGDDIYEGGMGYDRDTGRAYTDLSDSVIAFEAMRLTQSVEDLRPSEEKRVDLDWEAARRFLERVQNKESSGPDEVGGFFYRPDESKAGTATNEQGVVVFRSFGSMTYAGLLSLIYADVDRNDPRVRSAFEWSARHWSLEENPGMGAQGLFYFYNILAKALAAYGADAIPRPDGSVIPWRTALVEKLVALQRTESETGHGYWVNDNNRFWESNPELVTAYSVLALKAALGQ